MAMQRNASRSDGRGRGAPGGGGKSSTQHNAPRGGENFKVSTGTGDGGKGGRGKVTEVLGPMSATRKISNPKGGLSREHVGPAGAPYIDKGTY